MLFKFYFESKYSQLAWIISERQKNILIISSFSNYYDGEKIIVTKNA